MRLNTNNRANKPGNHTPTKSMVKNNSPMRGSDVNREKGTYSDVKTKI